MKRPKLPKVRFLRKGEQAVRVVAHKLNNKWCAYQSVAPLIKTNATLIMDGETK